jgi:hypothetical protein
MKRKKKLRPDRYVVGWVEKPKNTVNVELFYVAGFLGHTIFPFEYDSARVVACAPGMKVYELVEVTK